MSADCRRRRTRPSVKWSCSGDYAALGASIGLVLALVVGCSDEHDRAGPDQRRDSVGDILGIVFSDYRASLLAPHVGVIPLAVAHQQEE
jgi:hypothetical protein